MEAKSSLAHSPPSPLPPRRTYIRELGHREDRYKTLSARALNISELFRAFSYWMTVPVQWPYVNPVQGGLVFVGSIKALSLLSVLAPPPF
jgi:hypothetical protein